MIPGAGLYLPRTLHRNRPVKITDDDQGEAEMAPSKDSEWILRRQSPDLEGHSITISRRSSGDIERIFSSLPIVFDFADYASTQTRISSESYDFINLITRAREDVTEASRLYKLPSVIEFLELWPDKKNRIDSVLHDIQRALNDIGTYVQAVRIPGDGESANLREKFEWVLLHQKKLSGKKQYLTLCHQSLMATVPLMQAAEVGAILSGQDPVYEMPIKPWTNSGQQDAMRGPYSRRRAKSSLTNLSSPSIIVSEVDCNDSQVHLVNSMPAELHGSMPAVNRDSENRLSFPNTQGRSSSLSAFIMSATVEPPKDWRERSKSQSMSEAPSTMKNADLARVPQTATPSSPTTDRTPKLDSERPEVIQVESPTLFGSRSDPISPGKNGPGKRYDGTYLSEKSNACTTSLSMTTVRPREINIRKAPLKTRSLPPPSNTSAFKGKISYHSRYSSESNMSHGVDVKRSSLPTSTMPDSDRAATSQDGIGQKPTSNYLSYPTQSTACTMPTWRPLHTNSLQPNAPILDGSENTSTPDNPPQRLPPASIHPSPEPNTPEHWQTLPARDQLPSQIRKVSLSSPSSPSKSTQEKSSLPMRGPRTRRHRMTADFCTLGSDGHNPTSTPDIPDVERDFQDKNVNSKNPKPDATLSENEMGSQTVAKEESASVVLEPISWPPSSSALLPTGLHGIREINAYHGNNASPPVAGEQLATAQSKRRAAHQRRMRRAFDQE